MSRRAVLAAVPVVLVNVVAFAGQLSYWNAALVTVLAVLVAGTLESIAVYVAYHAHLAQLANDSALRLRLAAYGIAVVIGALNYSHWCAPGWRPSPAAVAFALCSVLSPWLWNIHTRRESRDELMKLGLLEPHAVRLGGTRWAWHPYRSARVMRHATWAAETDPGRAIGAVYPDVAGEHSPVSEPDGSPATRPVTAAVTPAVTVPSIAEIRARRDCSPKTAQKVQAELRRLIRSLPDPPAGAARPGNPNAPAGATPDPPAGHDKAAPAGARLGPAPDGAVHQAPAGANLNGRG